MTNQALTLTTPLLEVAYLAQGPVDGPPALLLHGWPDDANTWDGVAGALAREGFRVYAPFLRGFGPTRFRDGLTRRSGQVTALAQDAVDFADALSLSAFTLVGHDWGGRAAYEVAARYPHRLTRLVALAVPYGSGPADLPSLPQRHAYWYQWFFQTEQARRALMEERRALCHYLWETWMPTRALNEAEFAATAPAWDNPDWVEVTLHYYRHRWGDALPDPQYDDWEAARLLKPKIHAPTVALHGTADGCTLPASMEKQDTLFTGPYRREVLPGVGHFPQRERPEAVVRAVTEDI